MWEEVDGLLRTYRAVLIPTEKKWLENYPNMPTWTAGCLDVDIFASAYEPDEALLELAELMKRYCKHGENPYLKSFLRLPSAPEFYHEAYENAGKLYVMKDCPFFEARIIPSSIKLVEREWDV